MMKYIGVDGVAAITIVLYAEFILTSIFYGYSSGVAPIFSYNYGSKNTYQLKNIFKISMIFVRPIRFKKQKICVSMDYMKNLIY